MYNFETVDKKIPRENAEDNECEYTTTKQTTTLRKSKNPDSEFNVDGEKLYLQQKILCNIESLPAV